LITSPGSKLHYVTVEKWALLIVMCLWCFELWSNSLVILVMLCDWNEWNLCLTSGICF
jgi:hypothetical protein